MGVTLFVNLQGCGRPQEADGQMVDTHVFCYVVNLKEIEVELGCHRAFSKLDVSFYKDS